MSSDAAPPPACTGEGKKGAVEVETKAVAVAAGGDVLSDVVAVGALKLEAVAYAITHGLVMGKKDDPASFQHAPFSLLPSPVPRSAYEKAKNLATDFNTLVDRVSRNFEFLSTTLAASARADPFIGRLVEILRITHTEGVKQPLSLGIHRSDYMFHYDAKDGKAPIPLQVELNTIASSFGCLSARIDELHRYLLGRHEPSGYSIGSLAENPTLTTLPNGLARACKEHPSFATTRGGMAVMMIVQAGESNVADQRWLEYQLWENHKLHLVRRTLAEITDRGVTDTKTGDFSIDGKAIGVAYFRSGYTPRDFPSEKEWTAVLNLERSSAIKCPCIAYHLAGSKKVQQALAMPGAVERFLDASMSAKLRTCFAGLWGLENDDAETKAIIARAIASPDDYVLKPQREGGGNNLWGAEITRVLSTATVAERSAYILMQRIRPMTHAAAMVRASEVTIAKECASELGIYAIYLGDGSRVLLNEFGGHLLRTKLGTTDEGGVAAGFAVLDTPYLV